MNSKARTKKNLTRLIALILVGVMALGFVGYFTMDKSALYSYSDGLTKDGFFEGVTALDNVILPDYSAYTIPQAHTVASEDEITARIDAIRASFATQEVDADKERAIVDGDTVNISYVGKIDGVAFENGSTGESGADVTIGVTQYIDDFLQQLIGHKPGENFDIEVTFPEDYGNEELNGKDAVFNITVNHFYKTITPEITDDFIAEKLADTYENVEDMKEKVAQQIVDADTKNYVWNKLLSETTVTAYPEAIRNYEVAARTNNIKLSAAQYGVDEAMFLSLYGYESIDDYIADMDEDIKYYEKVYLTVQAVCEKEGITVTEEDLTAYFETMFGTDDYSDYETAYGKPYLKSIVMRDVMLKKLISNMEVVADAE